MPRARGGCFMEDALAVVVLLVWLGVELLKGDSSSPEKVDSEDGDAHADR